MKHQLSLCTQDYIKAETAGKQALLPAVPTVKRQQAAVAVLLQQYHSYRY
jgi:hypothetical protein